MFTSNSPEETARAGAECARGVTTKGEVLALTGDLGAGKTQFVKGFVAGIGSNHPVTSPTFTLIHEYDGGRMPVYHFDFYRLENTHEVMRLGLDEYLFGDGVCIIEWADRFPELLPAHARWISLAVQNENARAIRGIGQAS